MHERLGLDPLIDLKFRLGEGTGVAVCMNFLDLSSRILADIRTVEEVRIKDTQ
ncbi:MAG: nicotinate-nucleotide--dimethylbenzimidazole phosphoribosyltransferase [Desulfobacteraceae bacterium]|nr:nicotinate-nucleotide--dimethylbenzimidazole phosphoribosyltransferase [Desulfobacteraceae bacterium]